MPDIVSVIARRWKLIVSLTLAATALAFVACLLSPKKYLGMVTALPANSALTDRGSIFNQNIEELYTALGSPDELDKIEGTTKLDTIYLALAKNFALVKHYELDENDTAALYKAANRLKKNTAVNRTGHGELQIRVWDKNNRMAATLANAALYILNEIHQQLQTENNRMVLQRLKEEIALTQQTKQNSANRERASKNLIGSPTSAETLVDDSTLKANNGPGTLHIGEPVSADQSDQYVKLIHEYELALKTTPKVLLVVENARPLPYPDRPKTVQTVLLSFLASLLFSSLLILYTETRNQKA